jgi:hypothetical protein
VSSSSTFSIHRTISPTADLRHIVGSCKNLSEQVGNRSWPFARDQADNIEIRLLSVVADDDHVGSNPGL